MINPHSWDLFTGKCDNAEYDIRLKNGDIIENCVIGATGKFAELLGNRRIDASQVTEIRLSSPTTEELT